MEAFIRLRELETSDTKGRKGKTPFSPATIWRKSANGTFPKPVKLSDGVTAWRASEIEAWLKARCDERDGVTSKHHFSNKVGLLTIALADESKPAMDRSELRVDELQKLAEAERLEGL